jgi:uncharacterized membrane protein YkvA (DUF1232 family)
MERRELLGKLGKLAKLEKSLPISASQEETIDSLDDRQTSQNQQDKNHKKQALRQWKLLLSRLINQVQSKLSQSTQKTILEEHQSTPSISKKRTYFPKQIEKLTGIFSQSDFKVDNEEIVPIIKDSEVKNSGKIKEIINRLNLAKKNTQVQEIDDTLEKAHQRKVIAFFHRFLQRAKPEDVSKIDKNLDKMNRGAVKEIWGKIQALTKMVRDPNVAWKSKALGVAALVYLVSPFDAIADVIPGIGLTDDVALIIAVASTLANELETYMVRQAEKQAEIEVRKYNRIVRTALIGSIVAAVLAIVIKFVYQQL